MVVLVTGANRGIGLELVRQYAARGEQVIAVCRSASAELEAVDGVRIEVGVDVTDPQAIAALAQRLGDTRIDLLLNNAGILEPDTLDTLDADSVRRQFEINALAPLAFTHALLGRLGEGSKVALVTSRMGSIADNTGGGYYGYRMSKAALNAAGVSLAIDLAPRGIAVALLHPGYVRTDMTRGQGLIDPDQSARGLIERIDALSLETSGGFWHVDGQTLPW